MTEFLQKYYDCSFISFARQENKLLKGLNVLLHRLPLELAPFWSDRYRHELRHTVALKKVDCIFILHEGLFYLVDEIDVTKIPVTLFAHNILSRFSIDSPIQPVLTALSRRYEHRWYGKPGVRLVLISRGDRDEAVRLGIASPDAAIVPPGAPPAVPLGSQAVFTGQAVISSTFGWWRKRHDLKSFAKIGSLLNLIAFDSEVAKAVPNAVILSSASLINWSAEIRAGIITDRFAGGFKLTVLEHIARNCLVFSRARVREEYEGLPHAEEFVIDRLNEAEWPGRIAELKAQPQEELRRRFLEFKAACLARYEWAKCLAPLAPEGQIRFEPE